MNGLYLEDIEIGLELDLGSYHFSRERIVDFARDYDPQPFHLTDEGAALGPFGKLTASGWHTAAAWMKCYVAQIARAVDARRAAGLDVAPAAPSPGFKNLKWRVPVFVGDTLRFTTKVTDKRAMVTRPTLGLVMSVNEGVNQDGALVFSFDGTVMVHRRP